MKAKDFNPMKMAKGIEGDDLLVENKLVEQLNDSDDDERFGSPFSPDTRLRLAFRTGMAWAQEKEKQPA